MRSSYWAIALVLGLASTSVARDWFVDNVAGDDRKNGFSATSTSAVDGPVRTIAKALRHADHIDRIILANSGEPYRESISLVGRHSGIERAPFTIVGNGAVLDGQLPVPEDDWEFYRGTVFQFQPQRLSAAQQLFVDGKPLVKGAGVTADGRLPPLKQMEWRYYDEHIQFRPEDNRLPQSYALSYAAAPVGITLYQVINVEIQDLVVQGYQLDGINAHDSAFGVRLVGVTARGNGRSGISIGGSSQATLEGCLVGNNGLAQVRTEGWSHTRLVNCNLLDNTAPALVKTENSEVREVNE
jgi:parallel beta-helix repeat protein